MLPGMIATAWRLINGALSFFLVLGPLTVGTQYPVMYFSNPVFLLVLGLIYWKVAKRYSIRRLNR